MATTQENIAENPEETQPALDAHGQLHVTEQRIDAATGGQLWIVSLVTQPDPGLRIRIPSQAHDRQQILKTLTDQSEEVKLHLVKRPTDQCYEVLHAEPTLPDAKRAVHDEEGLVYTRTRELDDRVDELFQHAIQARIFAIQAKLLNDDKLFGPIVAHAKDVFAAQMQALGDMRATDVLGSLFDHGVGPSLEGAKTTYADAMMGRQLTGKGEVERIYYDSGIPLGQQIKVPEEPAVWAATVANYALQRAVYDYMHAFMCQTVPGEDGVPISFLQRVEANLVMQRLLYGFHPARTSADYVHLGTRLSGRLISATLQGVVCSMGGRAANEDYDLVTPNTAAPGRDEHGRPCSLQSYLYDKAYQAGQINHYADHEKNNGEPCDYLKKLNAACQESADEYVAAKETAVARATDRAMANGRTRLSDPGKLLKKMLEEFATAEKGLLSIFDEVEQSPPLIF